MDTQIGGEAGGSRNEFEVSEEVLTFRSRRCPGAPPPVVPPADERPEVSVESASPVSIVGATASGSGCPENTSRIVITPDGKAVSMSFESLSTARPSACSVTFQVEAPAGQAYALAGLRAIGQATLAAGSRARLFINTAFTGVGVDLARERIAEVRGPVDGPVELKEELAFSELNFSPCDGTRPPMRLSVRPDIAEGPGSFQVQTIDQLKFVLRKCE